MRSCKQYLFLTYNVLTQCLVERNVKLKLQKQAPVFVLGLNISNQKCVALIFSNYPYIFFSYYVPKAAKLCVHVFSYGLEFYISLAYQMFLVFVLFKLSLLKTSPRLSCTLSKCQKQGKRAWQFLKELTTELSDMVQKFYCWVYI